MRRFRTPLLVAVAFLAGVGTSTLAQSSTVTLQPGESITVTAADAPTTTVPETTTSTTSPPESSTTIPATTTPPTTTQPPTTTEPPVDGAAFVETFDDGASLDGFVFTVHDAKPFGNLGKDYPGDHSPPDATGMCGSPTSSRALSTIQFGRTAPFTAYTDADVRASGLAYWCANAGGHFMTALDTGGYAHFDFRPDRTFTDVSRVCWDQNITFMGGKWTEVAVVPVATFTANGNRMDYTHPSRNGDGQPGSWGLKILDGVWKGRFDAGGTADSSNDQVTHIGARSSEVSEDKALRTQHCAVDNGDGTVTMTRGRADGTVQSDTLPGVFPTGEVVVIFGDVSYNPSKRDGQSGDEFTWHWDNIVID